MLSFTKKNKIIFNVSWWASYSYSSTTWFITAENQVLCQSVTMVLFQSDTMVLFSLHFNARSSQDTSYSIYVSMSVLRNVDSVSGLCSDRQTFCFLFVTAYIPLTEHAE